MQYAETKIHGLKLGYYYSDARGDQNPDRAVLVLHGWAADVSLYQNIIEQLGHEYYVLAPYFPGFGPSDEPPAAFGVDDFADIIAAFCQEKGLKTVSMIGHSFGGRVIIKLAVRPSLPFKIDKLVIMDGAGIKHSSAKVSKKTLAFKRLKKMYTESLLYKIAPRFCEAQLEKARVHYGSADYRAASPRMRECMVKSISEDLSGFLPMISAPTLLIWGDKDQATPLEDAKLMEKAIPDAGLCVLEDCGHFSFLERPLDTARILASYFGLE